MSNPLPSRLAQAVSIALGSIGFGDMLGLFSAFGGDTIARGVSSAALLLVALLIFAGENAKANLINWTRARHAEGGWKASATKLGAAGFAFFMLISVCLTHQGIMAGERAFIGPTVNRLDAGVASARADLDARHSELRSAQARDAARIAAIQADIDTQPRDWRGDRQREALRARLDAAHDAAPARLAPYEQRASAAEAALAAATVARSRAPQGFGAVTIDLPFVGAVAIVALMVSIGIEFLSGFLPFVAAPGRRREIYLTDILSMDGEGLSLIDDVETVRAIGSRAQSIATKAGWVVRQNQSKINRLETVKD